ncbi:MAG: hypothetical protein AB7F32_09885, partial [Victivallaceae bacterium]
GLRNYSRQALLDCGLPRPEARRWAEILEATRAGHAAMDTWDFQWSYTLLIRRALAVVPAANLVGNLGTDSATHRTTGAETLNFTTSPLPDGLRFPDQPAADDGRDRLIFRLFYRQMPLWRRALAKLGRMLR